jgi:hypothetical protein
MVEVVTLGFKQREKKRKQKAAMAVAQAAARRSGSSSSSWWLTLVTRDTCCAVCGAILRKDREMVYRAKPREARCLLHGEGLAYRPSVAWERARRQKMKAR